MGRWQAVAQCSGVLFWTTFTFNQVLNYGHLSTTSLILRGNGSLVPLPTCCCQCLSVGKSLTGAIYIISLSVLKGHCQNPSGQWAVMITTTASVRCVSGVTVIVGIVTLGPVHSPHNSVQLVFVHSCDQFCRMCTWVQTGTQLCKNM